MHRLEYTVFRNAVSNVVRGASSAVAALVLPHFLVHSLTPDRFSAWSLILQIAAYASYLDFGLQLAISRFLAQAIELDQRERQKRLVGATLTLLTGGGFIAFLVIGFVILMIPRFFQGIPVGILNEVRWAAFILGSSAAILLPASTYTGILIGLHRNDVPAIVIASTRILGVLAAVIAAHFTGSLIVLAMCIATWNLFGGGLQWYFAGRLLPGSDRWWVRPEKRILRELLSYCIGLVVFSFSMFLVSGLDVTILGHFNFDSVGFYAIASLLVTFIAGLNSSVLGALMTPLAALQARHATDRIRRIVIAGTRASVAANLLGTGALFCFGPALLRIWVGQPYASSAYPIAQILMVAQLIRLIPNAYCTMLIATGQQMNAVGNSIFEGVVNLATSVVGAIYFGATGVAAGTLIGAVGGVAWVGLHTVGKDRLIRFSPRERAASVLIPCAWSLPVLLAWLVTRHLNSSHSMIAIATQALSLLASAALMIAFAGVLPERVRGRVRFLPSTSSVAK